METLHGHLRQHGRPVAFYSNRHSIFRVNHPQREGELTQFIQALKTLDIDPIHANTPQAKGRVKRANQTLQDRLVKELRLRGICDIESANAFLPEFIETYNRRFAVPPQNPSDAHQPLLQTEQEQELDRILCLHHTRTLSKNLTFQFKNREYQLQGQGKGYRLRGARITLCEAFDGDMTVLHQGQRLDYHTLTQGEPPVPLDDEKSVHHTFEQAKARQQTNPNWKPPADHPWRRPL